MFSFWVSTTRLPFDSSEIMIIAASQTKPCECIARLSKSNGSHGKVFASERHCGMSYRELVRLRTSFLRTERSLRQSSSMSSPFGVGEKSDFATPTFCHYPHKKCQTIIWASLASLDLPGSQTNCGWRKHYPRFAAVTLHA